MGAIHVDEFTRKLYLEPLPVFEGGDETYGTHLRVEKQEYGDTTEQLYELWSGDKQVVSFRARALPGCCGVLVVYYLRPSRTLSVEQATKLYTETVEIIVRAAVKAKYGAIEMTLLATSKAALNILNQTHGFAMLPFINGKSGNEVVHLFKSLGQERKAHQQFACE